MAKFNGEYSSDYAEQLMGEFFGNSLKYYKGEVMDEDYFHPITSMATPQAIEMGLIARFSPETLVKYGVAWDCEEEEREPRNGRKYGDHAIAFREDDPEETLQMVWNIRELNAECRRFVLGIVEEFTAARRKKAEGDPLRTRFTELQSFFKFTDLEIEALKYAFVRENTAFTDFPFQFYHRANNETRNTRANFLAMCIDRSVAEVRPLLSTYSPLRKYDFLDDDLEIVGPVQAYLNGEDDQPLHGRFYARAKAAEVLPWDFYDAKLRRDGALLERLIRSKKGGKGVNILLYGEPGSGKTSFARTLAKQLGRETYEILHGKKDGRDTSLGSRLIGIQVCNDQIPKETGMMVVDEADQILRTGGSGGLFGLISIGDASEKGQVNSMLDKIRVPTVWISNAGADAMDDSVRRRFDFSICFKKPSHAMRVNIWKNNIKKLGLGRLIPARDIDGLASRYTTSAGGISMVLKNLKEMAPKPREVPALLQSLMEPHCELMGAQAVDDFLAPAKDYTLEGLNLVGDLELPRIETAVGNFYRERDLAGDTGGADRPRMNLLLWGPPGTGKTEFVKYLAKKLDRPLVVKMGSDLLSMWVGGTEKNIRQAFEEAEADNAILFLDEIDGLVQDRSGAQRSWEVTQVNELLHRMENFRGVMVGATNFMDNLDAAIMRRFTFKLQFGYLKDDGKRLFFERMFGTSLAEAEAERLARIPNLAPGDFRTVRQSLYYLGGDVSNDMRLGGLERESALKKGAARSLGF